MARKAELQAHRTPPPLKVRKNRRVVLHYRIELPDGQEFDASPSDSPLEIICGRGDTVPGLEKRLLGMEPGDQREFVVPAEEAYGPYDEKLFRRIGPEELPYGMKPEVGSFIPIRSKGTEVVGRIVEIGEDSITADFNHPLAGKELSYEVHVLTVEELVPEAVTT